MSPEFGNFVLDLAYLNVISFECLAEKNPEKPIEEIEKTINEKVQRHFELMSLLDSFFARLRENSANGFDIIKPFINDFSEKLKEDFGKVSA